MTTELFESQLTSHPVATDLSQLALADALQTQQRERLWAATARVSRMLLEAQDVMAAMPQVLRELGEAAEVDRTALALAEIDSKGERWLTIKSEWVADGLTPKDTTVPRNWDANARKSDCYCSQLQTGRSVYVSRDQAIADDGSIASHFAKSSMIVPFLVDDEYMGVIGFDACRRTRDFDPAVVSALEIAASVIGAALHREQLIETVRHEREHAAEQRVSEIAKANAALRANLERLASTTDPYNFFGPMLQEATRQLNAAAASVMMLNVAGDEWRVMAHVRDGDIIEPPFAATFPNSETLYAEMQEKIKQPLYYEIDDTCGSPWPGIADYQRREGHRSIFKMPLVFGQHLVGFITLAFRHRDRLSAEQMEWLIAVTQQVTLAIGLKRLGAAAKNTAVLAERNRIGREIHDGLAQAFTGILMQLGAAEEMVEGSPLSAVLKRIGDIARDGLNEARRSVLALRPDTPRPGGLQLALQQLAERSTVPGRVTSHFEGDEVATGLAPEYEHALLRIAQEAVINAVRHAQPKVIKIGLLSEAEFLVLRVSDDGCGMEQMPELYAQQGFGLTNMRERAQAIGGQWQVESAPGHGTHISVRIPRQVRA